MPRQALERVLDEQFTGVDIKIEGINTERTESTPSDTVHVITKYVTTEFLATFPSVQRLDYAGLMYDVPLTVATTAQPSSPTTSIPPPEILSSEPTTAYFNKASKENNSSVYAWLPAERFQMIQDAKRDSRITASSFNGNTVGADGDGAIVEEECVAMSQWAKSLKGTQLGAECLQAI